MVHTTITNTMPTKKEIWNGIERMSKKTNVPISIKKNVNKAMYVAELVRLESLQEAKVNDTPEPEPKIEAETKKNKTSKNDKFLTLREKFNSDKLNVIISNKEVYMEKIRKRRFDNNCDQLKIAEGYLNKSKNGEFQARYRQIDGYGRFCAMGSMSLQSMVREIRHTIAKEYYDDIDMTNAHPVILSFICHQHNFKCPVLDQYNLNRERYLKELGCKRDVAKMVFLSLTNGGTEAYNNVPNQTPFLTSYKEELCAIHKAFAVHPDHKDGFDERKKRRIKAGKDFNHEASYMNTLLCDFENSILMSIWEFLGKPINAVLCFDGIMILKNTKLDIPACVQNIKSALGIEIQLKIKEMNEGFKIDTGAVNGDRLEMKLLTSDLYDEDYAEYFVQRYDCWHVIGDNVYYFQTGKHTWECGSEDLLYEFLGQTMYTDLREVLDRRFKTIELAEKHANICGRITKTLRVRAYRTGIVKCIIPKIIKPNDIFDQVPELVGFNNGIYNLLTGCFQAGQPSDYVSKSVGYNYMPPDAKKIKELMDFINKIMPLSDERDLLLKALASGAYGQNVQRFFILTGEGSNGKDTLVSKLFKFTLGAEYFEYSNTSILTEKRKGALSQEIANMNKKRIAVWNEPPKQSILQGGPIKELTGASEINARGLYSKNTVTQLMETCFMLCNDIPRIDNVDGGVARRMLVIPFRSLFKTEDEIKKMGNTENVHPVDRYYDSNEFRNEYKLTLFHILTEYFTMWAKDKFLFKHIPKTVLDLSSKYLQDSDDFISWFNERYEKTDVKNECIQIKNVYTAFKDSDLFDNMTKREKRLMTRKNLTEQIKKHPTLRGYHCVEYQPIVNGKRKLIRNAIKGFKLKPCEDADDEDDEDDGKHNTDEQLAELLTLHKKK